MATDNPENLPPAPAPAEALTGLILDARIAYLAERLLLKMADIEIRKVLDYPAKTAAECVCAANQRYAAAEGVPERQAESDKLRRLRDLLAQAETCLEPIPGFRLPSVGRILKQMREVLG